MSLVAPDNDPQLAAATQPRPAPAPAKAAVVEPLSSERYLVKFTPRAGLREKLSRLQSLMRSSVPDGDLAQVIERAVTEKLERLEARRFGKLKKPRKSLEQTDTAPLSRHIPAAIRRAVYERDGGHGQVRPYEAPRRPSTLPSPSLGSTLRTIEPGAQRLHDNPSRCWKRLGERQACLGHPESAAR